MDDQIAARPVPSEASGSARLRRVAGGRHHVLKVKLDDAEYAAVAERASALKISLQRLLVSSALAPSPRRGAVPRR